MWVAKLHEFAPAGFGTTGPALPAYLLDRHAAEPEPASSQLIASDGEESSGEEGDPDQKAERQHERRVERWSGDAAAQDARWQSEQDARKSQRVREAAAWDAAHGAERDAQHNRHLYGFIMLQCCEI